MLLLYDLRLYQQEQKEWLEGWVKGRKIDTPVESKQQHAAPPAYLLGHTKAKQLKCECNAHLSIMVAMN